MSDLIELFQKVGLEVGLIAFFIIGTVWLMKVLVGHFIKQMNQATDERKSITERYEHFMENHISENTKALTDNAKAITELIDHLHRFGDETHSQHNEIMEKLMK